MLRTRLQLFAICALLSVAGAVLADDSADQTLKDIAGYSEWTKVSDAPFQGVSVSSAGD